MKLTQYDHYRGGLARWRNQALIMGRNKTKNTLFAYYWKCLLLDCIFQKVTLFDFKNDCFPGFCLLLDSFSVENGLFRYYLIVGDDCKLLTILGGYYNGAGTVEIFDDSLSSWSKVSENPVLEKFYGFTAVGFADTIYTFGGALRREGLIGMIPGWKHCLPFIVNYVYKMDPSNFKFSANSQYLSTYRYGHR